VRAAQCRRRSFAGLSDVTGGVSGGATPTAHCQTTECDPGGGLPLPGHRAVYEHASLEIMLFFGEGASPWALPGRSRAGTLNAPTDESLLHKGTAMSRSDAWPAAVCGLGSSRRCFIFAHYY
jgi:hypothetical protein